MIRLRPGDQRGFADHGWLKSYHTFSFAGYYDPNHMGFGALRVINEDRVAPGQGFGTHPHDNMEIVSYVLEGELEHKDSMGNGQVLRPGEFQRITAGTGVTHSEFNPSAEHPAHFYQIWLRPEKEGLPPSYQQKAFDKAGRRNRWQRVASRDGAEASLTIHQDASIYLADLEPGAELTYELAANRHAWLQVLRGSLSLEEHPLRAGDAAAISDQQRLRVQAAEPTELMLFELA